MNRAPWPIGLLFGLSLAVVILLLGPLLLFNPVLTSALQVRHGVAAELGTSQAEVERVTASYLADIYLGGDFAASLEGQEPLLDAEERSHMEDVSALVRLLAGILVLALVLVGVGAAWLRHEPRRQGAIMLASATGIGAGAVVLALAFAVAFDAAFTAFHNLFFAAGTWQFPTGSDLITLFPQPFWFDAALLAGASVVVVALLVSVVGWWRWRAGRRPPPAA